MLLLKSKVPCAQWVFPFIFTGTGFATCSIKESAADSDADLDVDGDDTLEYGKAQYTEADIIPCSGAGEDQGEAREREALRGAVLKYEAFNYPTVQLAECWLN